MPPLIRGGIAKIVVGHDLERENCAEIMKEILDGEATPSQIGALLVGMRMKGETHEELLGFVEAMRRAGRGVECPGGSVDLCGTGGDGMGTFNISTASSFVVASLGVPVAKHGNTSITSRSGSADVLRALGVPIESGPEEVRRCMFETGIGFMFAPVFHPSMARVASTRMEVGIRSLFNMLGPLCNPAGVRHQLLGVYEPRIATLFSNVLAGLGVRRAMVVHGEGMDEITNLGWTDVIELRDGEVDGYRLHPSMFDMDEAEPEMLRGGDPAENARIMLSILGGEASPRADIVALNAGAALYIAGKNDTLEGCVSLAQKAIREGRALAKLEEFRDFMIMLEGEERRSLSVDDLIGRSLLPPISVERCAPLTGRLLAALAVDGRSREYLDAIDRSLIERPCVLGVIALVRALRLLGQNERVGEALDQAGRLSEAILGQENISIIGEVKPSSPSSPGMSPYPPERLVRAYSSAGFAGVSVLIEPDLFRGGPALFRMLRKMVRVPMLWKDFVIHGSQLEAAAESGADAVLIIAKLLKPRSLDVLTRRAIDLGLEPLLELHDLPDLRKAEVVGAIRPGRLIGVNSRDLGDLSVDLTRAVAMRREIPDDVVCVAESGIRSPEDLRRLEGFDAALIGSAFSASRNPESLAMNMAAASGGCRP